MLGYVKDHKMNSNGVTTTPTIEAMASAGKGISFYMTDAFTASMYNISGALIPEAKEFLIVTRLSDPKPKVFNPAWYKDLPILIPDFDSGN